MWPRSASGRQGHAVARDDSSEQLRGAAVYQEDEEMLPQRCAGREEGAQLRVLSADDVPRMVQSLVSLLPGREVGEFSAPNWGEG
jgi:hypothetical protein